MVTERKAVECLAFRQGEACEALVAAGRADRVDCWLGLGDDSELLKFVDSKRKRMTPAKG